MKALVRNLLKKCLGPMFARLYRSASFRAAVASHREVQQQDELAEQQRQLAEMTRFLVYEASTTRRLLRHLVADAPAYRAIIEQTTRSFNYQWGDLNESEFLLSNPDFQREVCDLVCSYTGLERSWFAGKRVLDAGCGSGRFSWALAQLGAEVTAFDQSANGLAQLQRAAVKAGLKLRTVRHNVLEPLSLTERFDLVWSFGVLHHTGDTYRGFQNLVPLVAEDGYFFLMLYGEPRLEKIGDFYELNQYERLRRAVSNKSFEEVLAILEQDSVVTDVHGWFDAVSPMINDLYSFEEVEGWLLQAGFGNVQRTAENRNLFMIAQRQHAAARGREVPQIKAA